MMESRKEAAVARKRSGAYNCAQAVACTYCDLAGLDEETMRQAASAYGLGLGCMEGTCGALTGAALVAGFVCKDRAQAMPLMKGVMMRFRERNGSTICKELKGIGSGVVLRPCNDCVADAAEFLEEALAQR